MAPLTVPVLLDQMEMHAAGASIMDRAFLLAVSGQPSSRTVRFSSPDPSPNSVAETIAPTVSTPRTSSVENSSSLHAPSTRSTTRSTSNLGKPYRPRTTLETSDSELSTTSDSSHDLMVDPDTDSDKEESRKIKKPVGEVGRPGRGGYNLEKVLKWPADRLDRVKRFIKTCVVDTLDCSVCFSDQPLHRLQAIREQAVSKYPFLADYQHLWVVDDLIKCRLKYEKTALRYRRDAELADETRKRRLVISIPPSKRSAV